MLFPYTYIRHDLEKMQEYVDYVFLEVWCLAPWEKYSIELFNNNPDLKDIITSLHFSNPDSADFFIEGIQSIFNIFSKFNNIDILRLKKWHLQNNDIESLCANSRAHRGVTYRFLASCFQGRYAKLSKAMHKFYSKLYNEKFLSLACIRKTIGTIKDHARLFNNTNTSSRCPFCGITRMLKNNHSKRNAYDHFLPKAKYPFNSINLKNLAPACDECNSSYKTSHDPLKKITRKGKVRHAVNRKAFYPYRKKNYKIEISMTLNANIDWTNLQPKDIELKTGPAEHKEEIETWIDLYGINERYKALFCDYEDGGRYWLEQVLEAKNNGANVDEHLFRISESSKKMPYVNENFLRKAFLDACDQAGLFSRLQPSA